MSHNHFVLKTTKIILHYTFVLIAAVLFLLISCKRDDNDSNGQHSIIYGDGVTDIDGNEYITVIIGGQEWMATNLKATTYSNGTRIPYITDTTGWTEQSSGAYTWYNNDEASFKNAYGALYNWYAIGTGKLCPEDWRIPTDADWTTLINYAGGAGVAGGKLKSTRTSPNPHPRWKSPNTAATNEYGFYALPGGYRSERNGTFYSAGATGYWWSSTESSSGLRAWCRHMVAHNGIVYHITFHKRDGFSVRCIRDN